MAENTLKPWLGRSGHIEFPGTPSIPIEDWIVSNADGKSTARFNLTNDHIPQSMVIAEEQASTGRLVFDFDDEDGHTSWVADFRITRLPRLGLTLTTPTEQIEVEIVGSFAREGRQP